MIAILKKYDDEIGYLCYMYLLYLCLFLIPNCVQAQIEPAIAAVVDDTCYVAYKGDSLLVVVTTSKFSDGCQINFDVSLVNHPFRSSKQMIPFFPQKWMGLPCWRREKGRKIIMCVCIKTICINTLIV